jgi:hypothetical protein
VGATVDCGVGSGLGGSGSVGTGKGSVVAEGIAAGASLVADAVGSI